MLSCYNIQPYTNDHSVVFIPHNINHHTMHNRHIQSYTFSMAIDVNVDVHKYFTYNFFLTLIFFVNKFYITICNCLLNTSLIYIYIYIYTKGLK